MLSHLSRAGSVLPVAVASKIISLVTPVTVLFAVLVMRMLSCSVKSRRCSVVSSTEVVVASLVVLFFFYPALAHTSLSMFACVRVDDAASASDPYPQYAIANSSTGYWVFDVRQACLQGEHLRWGLGLGLPFVICYCVLVPCGVWLFLHANRTRLTCAVVRDRMGFLYHCFTRNMRLRWLQLCRQWCLLSSAPSASLWGHTMHACCFWLHFSVSSQHNTFAGHTPFLRSMTCSWPVAHALC